MHAALIVMSTIDTAGMVFSELAREKDGQWGWMDKFKDTARSAGSAER